MDVVTSRAIALPGLSFVRARACTLLRKSLLPIAVLAMTASPSPGQTASQSAAAAGEAWWTKCVAIYDDRARLACFDASAPKDGRAPAAQETASATAAQAAPAGEPPSPPPAAERARSYRISAGYGLGIGSHAGTFELAGGTLHSQAGFGSEGDTVSVQAWADDYLAEDWSLGFEYLYLNNAAKLNLDLPNGASVLTDPITAHAYASLHGHIGFANVAYAPQQDARLRPFIGAGFGIGWGSAETDIRAQNDFAGDYFYKARVASVFAALQGFAGVDLMLTRDYYLSGFGKAVWVPGHPYSVDHRYVDFVFGGALGRRF